MQDETILRLFPVLRRSWSEQGRQARVYISGRNAQMALSCTIDITTGKRLLLRHKGMTAQGFQQMLHKVRSAYGMRPVYMLIDAGGLHRAKSSLRLAEKLNITMVFLPKQAPELNAVDQLWKHVKAQVSANRQYQSIDEHAEAAEAFVKRLTPKQTLILSSVLSENFWLRLVVETNFCKLT